MRIAITDLLMKEQVLELERVKNIRKASETNPKLYEKARADA